MATRFNFLTTATRVAPYTFHFAHEGRTWQCTVVGAEHLPSLGLTVEPQPGLPDLYCSGAVFATFEVTSKDLEGYGGSHTALECLLVQTTEQKTARARDFTERWEEDQADAQAKGQTWRLRTAPDGCSMPVIL